jgi:uncharacterized membrane protein
METSAKKFFTKPQQEEILQAIKNAELNTGGEIRVHIENKCPGDVLDRAAQVFDKLQMQKTALRNGVLIYLSIENRKFAILGDAGINAVVPENFWDDIKTSMLKHFKERQFIVGLTEAIHQAGDQLKKHFPYLEDDVNELPDDISFGEK